MQIKKQDRKNQLIELVAESTDDLWHLSHIVGEGDVVSTLTTRRIQDTNSGKTRADRGVKKTFYLTVKVEKVSFHKYTSNLRFTGTIQNEVEDLITVGSYHTINVEINKPIKIIKNWDKWSLRRLNTAVDASKRPTEIIVAIEDNTTDLGIIKQYGIEYRGPITGDISGKRNIQKDRKSKTMDYYADITSTIKQLGDVNKLIIVGPGFTKNGYYDYLQDKEPSLAKKSVLEATGAGGHAGIEEVLKNGLVESLSKDAKIAKETTAVNKLLEAIAKSMGDVTYGKNQCLSAANMGAIEKLLVVDHMIRDNTIQNIMNTTENMGGSVEIISSEHDAGKQLEALGNLGAFLRYPI